MLRFHDSMKKNRRRTQLLLRTTVAALAGGSLFGACDTRFRGAFVDSTKIVISQGLGGLGADIAVCITDADECAL